MSQQQHAVEEEAEANRPITAINASSAYSTLDKNHFERSAHLQRQANALSAHSAVGGSALLDTCVSAATGVSHLTLPERGQPRSSSASQEPLTMGRPSHSTNVMLLDECVAAAVGSHGQISDRAQQQPLQQLSKSAIGAVSLESQVTRSMEIPKSLAKAVLLDECVAAAVRSSTEVVNQARGSIVRQRSFGNEPTDGRSSVVSEANPMPLSQRSSADRPHKKANNPLYQGMRQEPVHRPRSKSTVQKPSGKPTTEDTAGSSSIQPSPHTSRPSTPGQQRTHRPRSASSATATSVVGKPLRSASQLPHQPESEKSNSSIANSENVQSPRTSIFGRLQKRLSALTGGSKSNSAASTPRGSVTRESSATSIQQSRRTLPGIGPS
ncbi:uncharacterized protein BJ171DRAFT_493136 [Polychytrium aggregatum]|uniref:uncharacterized protein n=1 Tax=Polychytrium aggregatum TaxID=110093 RepID=UPI0022FEF101|nr:uncharacterized protein BJ171DRAFT_493136 [Polychytrium aggregatum]KAI9207589.1 hypothetical protein BJ171DRAFT_493136 [Polychytrium aggregatum]